MTSTFLAYILMIWCGLPEFSHGYIQEVDVKVIADNGEIVDHHYHNDEEPTLHRYKRAYNPVGGVGDMHLLSYHPDQTYTYDVQSKTQCTAQLKEVRDERMKEMKKMSTYVAAIVDQGDTVLLQCHFCADHDRDVRSAKIWFKSNHGMSAIDSSVSEVKLDAHDDEEINRVYSTTDHTLVIKNMSLADAGTYFCEDYELYTKQIKNTGLKDFEEIVTKLATAGGVNNEYVFMYHVDVLLPSDQNIMRVSREQGSYLPIPREIEVNHEERYGLGTLWGSWGPCSICGKDKYGERKRRGTCVIGRIRTGWPVSAKLSKILGMFIKNVPCHSSLFHRFTKIVSYPDQIEVEKCQVICIKKDKTAEAQKFSEFEDLNDIIVEETGNVDDLGNKVKKQDIKEEEGTNIRLICPGSTLETAVMWQNGSAFLKERNVEEKSHGRLSFDMTDALIIRNLTHYDSGVYTCWYDARRQAKFTLRVPEAPRVPYDELHRGLGYLGMCYSCYLLVFLACLGVKHKQRMVQVRKKKSTGEAKDENISKEQYSQVRRNN